MFKRIGRHVLLGTFAVAMLATGAWSAPVIELTYANFPPPEDLS